MSNLKSIVGAIILIVVVFLITHLIMSDRQLHGQFRPLFVSKPKQHFKNKYETPHFRKYNLMTMTDRLNVCRWLEGEKGREKERGRVNERGD